MQLNEVQRRHLAVTRFFFPRICAAGGGPPAPGQALVGWAGARRLPPPLSLPPGAGGVAALALGPCCLPWPRYPRGSGRVRQLSSWPRAADAGLLLWQMLPGLELLALGKGCPRIHRRGLRHQGAHLFDGFGSGPSWFSGPQQVTIASHLPPLPPAFPFSKRFSIHFSSFQ